MRVLRLGLGDDRAVDLHPAVSVVTGLDRAQRTALRRGFGAIGAGVSPGQPGLVEAHGLLLDATQDDLDLLDIAASATSTVVTLADVAGSLPEDDAEGLRAAERDVVRLAAGRWAMRRALAAAELARSPLAPEQAERVVALRDRIARQEARRGEGVRVALDRARDVRRAGGVPDPTHLVAALADVGLDTADLGLPVGELACMAEDWLDEYRREADWVVGARIELQAIEDRDLSTGGSGHVGSTDDADELRRRTTESAREVADALVHSDERRSSLLARHAPRPGVAALLDHLVGRLPGHRPDRLAGAVPLVLDGLLAHLEADEVMVLLGRTADLAGPVQLVVVDDHPVAAEWVEAVGVRRAAAVAAVADPGPT